MKRIGFSVLMTVALAAALAAQAPAGACREHLQERRSWPGAGGGGGRGAGGGAVAAPAAAAPPLRLTRTVLQQQLTNRKRSPDKNAGMNALYLDEDGHAIPAVWAMRITTNTREDIYH
jgi:hypothetical protein